MTEPFPIEIVVYRSEADFDRFNGDDKVDDAVVRVGRGFVLLYCQSSTDDAEDKLTMAPAATSMMVELVF